ncbi:hypothetical protein [Parablautia intestinalis]|nr:hypothetical protein [Parablautia intestinalis]
MNMFGNGMNQNTLIQIIEEQTSRDLWYITPGMKIFRSLPSMKRI